MFRFGCYLLVTLAILAIQIEAACLRGRLKPQVVGQDGSILRPSYCEYKKYNYGLNSTWSHPYPDCLDCRCNNNGLTCCGYGIAAGVIIPPTGCQIANGTCNVKFVKTSNPSQPC